MAGLLLESLFFVSIQSDDVHEYFGHVRSVSEVDGPQVFFQAFCDSLLDFRHGLLDEGSLPEGHPGCRSQRPVTGVVAERVQQLKI